MINAHKTEYSNNNNMERANYIALSLEGSAIYD